VSAAPIRTIFNRSMLLVVPAALVALYVFTSAQASDDFYEYSLGDDVTSRAADVTVEPRFRALVGDKFAYDVDVNTVREGISRRGDTVVGTFRRTEHWASGLNVLVQEDELEGRRDPRIAVRFDRLIFLIDNGEARYSGYIGPERGGQRARFTEIQPNGSRNEVNNIPGWAGVNARTIESNRNSQATGAGASAWLSVDNQGRLYNEVYFAGFDAPDQNNYPARFQDPVHLALAIVPQFEAEAALKIGETTRVRRRMPVGAIAGATVEYDVTYTLEKLYAPRDGSPQSPTSARFTFRATPVTVQQQARVDGLQVRYEAPEITDGVLLLDLVKGVAAFVSFSYEAKGTVADGDYNAEFKAHADVVATLRRPPPNE